MKLNGEIAVRIASMVIRSHKTNDGTQAIVDLEIEKSRTAAKAMLKGTRIHLAKGYLGTWRPRASADPIGHVVDFLSVDFLSINENLRFNATPTLRMIEAHGGKLTIHVRLSLDTERSPHTCGVLGASVGTDVVMSFRPLHE